MLLEQLSEAKIARGAVVPGHAPEDPHVAGSQVKNDPFITRIYLLQVLETLDSLVVIPNIFVANPQIRVGIQVKLPNLYVLLLHRNDQIIQFYRFFFIPNDPVHISQVVVSYSILRLYALTLQICLDGLLELALAF